MTDKQQQGKPQAQGREDKAIKPPIGILTQWRHRELRIDEINEAVERYNEMNYNFPIEWIIERREHLSWLHQHLPTSPYLIGWNPDSFIKAAPASSIPTEVQKEERRWSDSDMKSCFKAARERDSFDNTYEYSVFGDYLKSLSAPPISHKEDEKD